MAARKTHKKPKSGKLYLTPKQAAVLHRIVQEFDENGGHHQFSDSQMVAYTNVTEKLERVLDYVETVRSL